VEVVRDRRAAVRREDVACEERAVARVEERDVARAVAGTRDDLEAPDAVAVREPDIGRRRDGRPAAGQLAVDDLLAGEDARVELGHEHLDRVAEALLQPVDRPRVVAVAVGERDPPDRGAGVGRGGDQRVGGAAHRRVDEREPVVLADEIRVHEVQAVQSDEVRGDGRGLQFGTSGS